MNLNGVFYSAKKNEYTSAQMECIENAVVKFDKIGHSPLMMLGKIQSGKTKSFIGVISLAFDNGFDLAVVLTKNSNALSKQTTARMNDEFKTFVEDDSLNIYDIMRIPENLSRYELNQKMILVVKKQHKNLPKLMKLIEEYSLEENKKCLIIDDEADFTSIGFSKNKETEQFNLKKIASQINDLRLKLECKFIQVTATPYSLYLQPEEIHLNNNITIKPIRPSHTVLVPSGDAYIGGEYYFDDDKNPLKDHLFYEVDTSELEIIKSSDRRRLKEEEALKSNKIIGLRSAIINFITGGCIRIIQNGGQTGGRKNKFSFIIHTEIQTNSHKRQADLIYELIKQIEEEIWQETDFINSLIEESYNQLKESVISYGFEIPSLTEIKETFYKAVKEEWISRIVVNSENDIETLLDSDGQLKLRTPLTIFVGGQILDRGVTISNLIGFYYGRRPKSMQQDTVLQHSRMFGYRSLYDLAVTRFYTTNDLYSRMYKINEFDTRLRDDFESGKLEDGIIFISRDEKGKIIPCSPSKILITNTKVIKPGERILPVGFSTKSNTMIKRIIHEIDKTILENNSGQLRGEFKISKDDAIKIINCIYDSLILENEHTVTRESFTSLLKYLSNQTVNVVSRADRRIRKHRKSRYYSDRPDNGDMDLIPAKRLAIDEPSLILLKQKGLKEDGWNNAEFWWPVLVVPENVKTSVFATEFQDIS
ncbi:Z1 domain-containing protein [Clostridium formicaceticum]|uniref:Z1 domain protein n=1 Tax=Clostridium formicaceticum TaxID=1497 RepID=A0AAC9RNQ4_9CLOT|nr:Z1 domain-containing protein [Clostridium formicaceticum]ARE89079.1 Z1 domain protein [Clostridium formicaceticum]